MPFIPNPLGMIVPYSLGIIAPNPLGINAPNSLGTKGVVSDVFPSHEKTCRKPLQMPCFKGVSELCPLRLSCIASASCFVGIGQPRGLFLHVDCSQDVSCS